MAHRTGHISRYSAPQHKKVNTGAGWRKLEDSIQGIVKEGDIEVVWTISGTLYRDKENRADEAPEHDFEGTRFIGGGFGVPKATYKVVGWFDKQGLFQSEQLSL